MRANDWSIFLDVDVPSQQRRANEPDAWWGPPAALADASFVIARRAHGGFDPPL